VSWRKLSSQLLQPRDNLCDCLHFLDLSLKDRSVRGRVIALCSAPHTGATVKAPDEQASGCNSRTRGVASPEASPWGPHNRRVLKLGRSKCQILMGPRLSRIGAAVCNVGPPRKCPPGARPGGWRSRSEKDLADVGVVVHREQASAAVFLHATKRVCAQTAAAV